MLPVMKIAIQGQEASFHDVAAHQFFNEPIELICCESFSNTFTALMDGTADAAVVAIENSLYGTINPVYDLLLQHRPWISGETYLRIHQCLVGLPGASLHDITEVYSHAAALAQCETFLTTQLAHAKRYEHADTAGAAADVAAWGDPTKAAIASAAAAERYGLRILAPDIETHHHNYTRFIVLHRDRQPADQADKTSIVLRTAHQSGALYHALGALNDHGYNMTLLTSRPVIGHHQKYMFYMDFEAAMSAKTSQVLDQLRAQGCDVLVLGSYLAATLPE
jgi:prephenate dehydratase